MKLPSKTSTILFILIHTPIVLMGQLDSIHWIAPLPVPIDLGWQNQYIYLSTPLETPFKVWIKDNRGNVLEELMLSKEAPQVIAAPMGRRWELHEIYYRILISKSEAREIMQDKGIIIEGQKAFYANYRVHEENHAASFTTKGRTALGKDFRIGHYFTTASSQKNNFFSIISTQDSTVITITDFAEGLNTGIFSDSNGSVTLSLPEMGNTLVVNISGAGHATANALLGARVQSNHPISIISGSWTSSPGPTYYQDIGMDQLIPAQRIGDEYILVRGNGPDALETPIVVGHYDGTEVFVNGGPTAFARLDAGDYLVIPSDKYSEDQNIHIRTSQPAYVFQSLGGTDAMQTGGFNFVPPLACSENNLVDKIVAINQMGEGVFEGGVFIISQKQAEVSINNGAIPVGVPKNVLGAPDYVTYKIEDLSGDITVESTGPVKVGYFGYFENAGWASYYSGFPQPEIPFIEIERKNGCPDTLFAHSNVSGQISWYRDSVLLSANHEDKLVADRSGNYQASLAVSSSCTDSDGIISSSSVAVVVPPSPEIVEIKTIEEAICNLQNGAISITSEGEGAVTYSLDGINFQTSNEFNNLDAGDQTIYVKDENGCVASTNHLLAGSLPPVITAVDVVHTECGENNGSIAVKTEVGSGGSLQYSMDTILNQQEPIFDQLSPGQHTVLVRDNLGCVASSTIQVDESYPPKITHVTLSPTTCGLENGKIEIIIDPDNGDQISYSINDSDYQDSGSFVEMSAGHYDILIKDEKGCRDSTSVNIEESHPPSIDTALVDPTSCGDANGSAQVLAHAGTGSVLRYGINQEELKAKDLFDNLPSGSHSIRISDEFGCIDSMQIIVPASLPPVIEEIQMEPARCNQANGEIHVFAREGTAEVISYALVDQGQGLPQVSNVFDSLASGNYLVHIMDEAACEVFQEVELAAIPPPEIQIKEPIEYPKCAVPFSGRVEVVVTGGRGDYQYRIDGDEFQFDNIFDSLDGGVHEIQVIDSDHCQGQIRIKLSERCLGFPNIFNPNSVEASNRLFGPFFANPDLRFAKYNFRVFDRWGKEVFSSVAKDDRWDGNIKGRPANQGVYVWQLAFRIVGKELEIMEGDVTLIR